jgi:beta-lactam-binding protein with PASTA domain/tRNA A-37 threonylcarbamoyl transferase component Bud32
MNNMIGKMLDNRYELLEVIGSGGMAVVYKAKCHRLNRLVAVKVLKSDLAEDADFRRRFRDESQAVAMLSHPNIVSVYDVSRGETEYIVMELIDGITLKQYMEKRGQLNWREALHFITQIMKALSHAHSRGIIHRDIKPQNIMVLRDGSVKVADFGIACLANSANTLTQEALGSVHYMSPEQARGDRTDARSDIYSAGVVLYEMLTGRLPFEGDNAVSVAIQHLSSVPLSPREINPDVPEALELICMKAMASDLEKRYASADEMLADLEEFRKNPEVDLDFTIEDLHRETVDEPTQYIPAVHTVSKAQKVQEADDEEEEEASPHKLGTRKLLTIIGAAVAAVALIVLLWHAIFSDLLGGEQTPTEYVVPRLIGMTIDEANEDENVKGIFTIEQIGQRASSKYAAGQIIEQSPERGKTVKGNRVISVFVSSGAKTEKMPNLVNSERRNAALQLKNLDLSLVVDDTLEEYSESITAGYVIRTIPEAGMTLNEGDSVTLVVSKGSEKKTVTVITFTGSDIEIVRQQATQMGLVVGDVSSRADVSPIGTVLEQSIAPNTDVKEGTVITFVVSSGPDVDDGGEEPSVEGEELP